MWVSALTFGIGRIVRIAPKEVDICDVDAVKTIYTVRETFLKPVWYQHFTTFGLENVFNTNNVEFHRRHRRLLSGPISESSLREYRHLIDARCRLTLQRIREDMRSKGAADLFKWWMLFATDVIGEMTFGESFKTLEHGEVSCNYAHGTIWRQSNDCRETTTCACWGRLATSASCAPRSRSSPPSPPRSRCHISAKPWATPAP